MVGDQGEGLRLNQIKFNDNGFQYEGLFKIHSLV